MINHVGKKFATKKAQQSKERKRLKNHTRQHCKNKLC